MSRRNPGIRRPIESISHTAHGIPYLASEIELFYKAKDPCPKDEADFAAVRLDTGQREWLAYATEIPVTSADGPEQ